MGSQQITCSDTNAETPSWRVIGTWLLFDRSQRRQIGHCSRADADSVRPSVLPGSNTTINRSPDQPWALSCHTQRVQPATAASQRRPIGRRSPDLRRLPASRHAAGVVAGVAASPRASDNPDLPIEGARTRAHGASTGVVAGFRAFRRDSSAHRPLDSAAWPTPLIWV